MSGESCGGEYRPFSGFKCESPHSKQPISLSTFVNGEWIESIRTHRWNFSSAKSSFLILQHSRIEFNSSVVVTVERHGGLAEVSRVVTISGTYCCESSRRKGWNRGLYGLHRNYCSEARKPSCISLQLADSAGDGWLTPEPVRLSWEHSRSFCVHPTPTTILPLMVGK